jgi:hypothetical protein
MMIAAAAPDQLRTGIPPSARGGNLTSMRARVIQAEWTD